MTDNKKNTKSTLLIVITILILLCSIFGVTYAAFFYSKDGEKSNNVSSGTITMSYSERNNGINLTDAYPMTDEVGMTLSNNEQYFDFNVSASMSGSTIIDYVITGVKDSISSTLPDDAIKVYLSTKDSNRENVVLAPTKISDLRTSNDISFAPDNQFVLLHDNFRSTESRNYRLRMWISSDYNLAKDAIMTYSLKVNVYGNMAA